MSITGVSVQSVSLPASSSFMSNHFTGKVRIVTIALAALTLGLLITGAVISYRRKVKKAELTDVKNRLDNAIAMWKQTDKEFEAKNQKSRCKGFKKFTKHFTSFRLRTNIKDIESVLEKVALLQPLFKMSILSWDVDDFSAFGGAFGRIVYVPIEEGVVGLEVDQTTYERLLSIQKVYKKTHSTAFFTQENREVLRDSVPFLLTLITKATLQQSEQKKVERLNIAIDTWTQTQTNHDQLKIPYFFDGYNRFNNSLVQYQKQLNSQPLMVNAVEMENLTDKLSVLQPLFELAISGWRLEGAHPDYSVLIPKANGKTVRLSIDKSVHKKLTRLSQEYGLAHWPDNVLDASRREILVNGASFAKSWSLLADKKLGQP